LLCACAFLFSGGCGSLIARSGTDPSELATRDQVHQALGQPVATEVGDRGSSEDYRCHAKVAENTRAALLFLEDFYTLGLADLCFVPYEVGRYGWKAVSGYDLRFHYDETGRVTECTIDGVPAMPWPLQDSKAPLTATGTTPPSAESK
jgi:hypothetical protein